MSEGGVTLDPCSIAGRMSRHPGRASSPRCSQPDELLQVCSMPRWRTSPSTDYERFERIYEGIDQLGTILKLATNPRVEQYESVPDLKALVDYMVEAAQ